MADIRINSLPTTASASSSNDFLAIDGATNGTRKLSAYNPTFGGAVTVNGTGTYGAIQLPSGTTSIYGVAFGTDTNLWRTDSGNLELGGSSVALIGLNVGGTNKGYFYNNGTDTTLAGAGTLTFKSNGTTTGLTLDSSNATVAGNLTVSGTGTSSFAGVAQFAATKGVTFNTSTDVGLYGIGFKNDGSKFPIRVSLANDSTTPRYFQVGYYSDGTQAGTWTNSFEVNAQNGNATLAGNLTVSGAGTSSVAGKLQLGATTATGYNTLLESSGITTGRGVYQITSTGAWLIAGIEASAGGTTLTGSTAYASYLGSFTNTPLHLVSNSTIGATLFANGNLFIGASPVDGGQKLQVSGGTKFSDSTAEDQFNFYNNATTPTYSSLLRLRQVNTSADPASTYLIYADVQNGGSAGVKFTVNENGKLQLATHTTSAGGIGFGADVSLYHAASAGQLTLDYIGGSSPVLNFAENGTVKAILQTSSGSAYLTTQSAGASVVIRSGANTTALTLDSSQRIVVANATNNGSRFTMPNNSAIAWNNAANSGDGGSLYFDNTNAFQLRTGSGASLALTLDSSQNATFVGKVKSTVVGEAFISDGGSATSQVYSTYKIASGAGYLIVGANGSAAAGGFMTGGSTNSGAITTVGTTPLQFGTNQVLRLSIDGSTGDATFAGNVTVNGVGNNSIKGDLLFGSGAWPTSNYGRAADRVTISSSAGGPVLGLGDMQTGVAANRGATLYLFARGTNATNDIAGASFVSKRANATSGNFESTVEIGVSTASISNPQTRVTIADATTTFSNAIAINNTVQTAVAVASTHKVTISIGGSTYYLLATNV